LKKNAIVKSIGVDVFIWLWGAINSWAPTGTTVASFLLLRFFLNGANEVCNNVVDVTCCLVWVLSAPLRRLCLGRLLKAVDSKRAACCLVTKLVLLWLFSKGAFKERARSCPFFLSFCPSSHFYSRNGTVIGFTLLLLFLFVIGSPFFITNPPPPFLFGWDEYLLYVL
jgi:hypothetical protein